MDVKVTNGIGTILGSPNPAVAVSKVKTLHGGDHEMTEVGYGYLHGDL